MKFVLITSDKLKYIINEGEYNALLEAINRNDKAFIIRKYKALIPLHITPSIAPLEIWYAQENERLALTHHRLCKKCLRIMLIADKCVCWPKTGKSEKGNAFMNELPPTLKNALAEIASRKVFPKLDEADKSGIEFNNNRGVEPPRMVEDGGVEGYVDEEGITHYE